MFSNLCFSASLQGRPAKVWLDGGGEATHTKDGGTCGGRARCLKPIIKNLTGCFLPGKMTAIMGASGAGKTTLLKAIAGEGARGVLTGELQVNGHNVDTDTIRRESGFVFQDDLIMATMTVREAITFSARLRLPPAMPLAEKVTRVEQVIQLLHLDNCADTIIGSALTKGGISGGERKRVAIGMELITNPSILFLDEPTTGLDTYTAYSVVNTLHHLADSGRTIVATIHQPSSDIFHLFDNLIVLSQGHIVYQGPAQDLVSFAAELDLHCDNYVNPADFLFMQILNSPENLVGDTDQDSFQAQRLSLLATQYKASTGCQQYLEHNMTRYTGLPFDLNKKIHAPNMLEQMWVIGMRNFRNVARNPMGMRAKLFQAIFMGAVVAAIFYNLKTNQSSTQDRIGSLFFMAMTMMNGAFSILALFGQERLIVEREQALGLYSTAVYFIPKVLTELPQNLLGPVLQGTIVFFALGYNRTYVTTVAEKYFFFIVTVVLTANTGNGLGIFIASIFPDLRITLVAAPPMILPLMIFSGFFINTASVPVYLMWIKYLSPMFYAFQAYCHNEFTGLLLTCDADEYVTAPTCPADNPKCMCPLTTGEEVLQSLNFDMNLNKAHHVVFLCALFIGFHVLAFFALRRIVAVGERNRTKLSTAHVGNGTLQ
jgi:ABC-type multidrug transport system ATPase subunit